MVSNLCVLSPPSQHSRQAFVLSASSRAPKRKAATVEMLKDAF